MTLILLKLFFIVKQIAENYIKVAFRLYIKEVGGWGVIGCIINLAKMTRKSFPLY